MSDEKYQTFGQLCTNKNAVEEYLGREIPSKSDKMDIAEWLRKSSSDEWCGSALNKCADEIERLREENARLREAVKAAYYEGWQDNASIDDTEDRLHAEWEHSEARVAIQDGGKDA